MAGLHRHGDRKIRVGGGGSGPQEASGNGDAWLRLTRRFISDIAHFEPILTRVQTDGPTN